ncbi:hypothetical protein JNW90_13725 [Micromonospora sp. STR1s_5]|nr:hypothetical protein [Micromonospora sp. STR1s_5]
MHDELNAFLLELLNAGHLGSSCSPAQIEADIRAGNYEDHICFEYDELMRKAEEQTGRLAIYEELELDGRLRQPKEGQTADQAAAVKELLGIFDEQRSRCAPWQALMPRLRQFAPMLLAAAGYPFFVDIMDEYGDLDEETKEELFEFYQLVSKVDFCATIFGFEEREEAEEYVKIAGVGRVQEIRHPLIPA